ncbi:MAG: alpha/beta hydrolase [Clostridiales bacterium]|nr:alpha/beta hydrolase [Clostridiales bacterium]
MEEKKNPEVLDYDALEGSLKFDGPPTDMEVKMADISWVKRKKLDVVYAEESPNQRLDLYYPEEGEGPFAVLLHIHGGGFGLGDKRDDHMDTYLKFLKKGIVVGSIEYRLSGEALFPAAVLDCREAVRFLRRNAADYELDPDHIGVIGGSAGGNLSAILGMNIPNGEFYGEEGKTFEGSCEVNVAVDQFGPTDFAVMDDMARENGVSFVDHDLATSAESSYMGAPLQEVDPELLAKGNPITYINPKMSPILVQHGLKDRLVPYQQSIILVDAIKEQIGEDRVELTILPEADHEDALYGTDENLKIVWEFVEKYL